MLELGVFDMITILIVDDERIERNGIRFLLGREEEEVRILEAENGRAALAILEKQPVDVMFSDVKMPYMDGLELVGHTSRLYPDMITVFFSGYSDFDYVQNAIRYGVQDYVLKPVNPKEFHKTFLKISQKYKKKKLEEEYLFKSFLLGYLSGRQSTNKNFVYANEKQSMEFLSQYRSMVLVSGGEELFEHEEEDFLQKMKAAVNREFLYLNLNCEEAVFLFKEQVAGDEAFVMQMYCFLKNALKQECYLAVSRDMKCTEDFKGELQALYELMTLQFYQPEEHIFWSGCNKNEEPELEMNDTVIMENIADDIKYRDIERLQKNFHKLTLKYRSQKQFAQMYVKYIFSDIIKNIYEQIDGVSEQELSEQVDAIYRCKNIQEVTSLVEKAIADLEGNSKSRNSKMREEVIAVKAFIADNYDKNLSIEKLADQVYLSPGYLSTIFKDETGMNLNHFIRDVRLNKAKKLLETSTTKISQIAKEVGFHNSSYFCRSFREYFGVTPESCRKTQKSN